VLIIPLNREFHNTVGRPLPVVAVRECGSTLGENIREEECLPSLAASEEDVALLAFTVISI
jgi:hypothetical protein